MGIVSPINVIHFLVFVLTVKQDTYASKQSDPKCNDKIPKVCHYVVVGAGAAGAVVASRLSEDPYVVVCLFEAGTSDLGRPLTPAIETPRLFTTTFGGEFTWNYTTVPQKALNGRKFSVGMGKALGGSTTHNAMAYYRGFKADYDYWASNGATEWSYKEILPFFFKLENNTTPFKRNTARNSCGPLTLSVDLDLVDTPFFELFNKATRENKIRTVECLEPSPFGLCNAVSTIKFGKRESTSTAYLRPSAGRRNFLVFTESFVEKILIQRKGKRAYGIQVQRSGRRYFVYAKREIIVSGGTFDSAKLLQRSGIGPKRLLRKLQIKPHSILPVGENLHDHALLLLDIFLNFEIDDTFKMASDPKVLAEYIFRRKGFYAGLGSKSMFLDSIRQKFNWPEFQVIIPDSNSRATITKEGLKDIPENRNKRTLLFILLHPKSRGTVQLRSRNPNDPPLIDPNVLHDKDDVKQLIKGVRIMQRFIQSPSMRKAGASVKALFGNSTSCKRFRSDSDEQWECILRNSVVSDNHVVSSCKMGNSRDPSTVVDPNLRVKGIKGLRVADASIMPEVTSTNTQGPSIMIGEKAAHIIRKQYRRY